MSKIKDRCQVISELINVLQDTPRDIAERQVTEVLRLIVEELIALKSGVPSE